MLLHYLTHPQVRIDPTIAVPDWGLSDIGHARIRALVDSGALSGIRTVVSSCEQKAIETAEPIAAALGLSLVLRREMHENDRSATGFLPPEEFEEVANQFFASPESSIRGWERAADAQARIVRETRAVVDAAPEGDILIVGHGGVGTLLYCHLAGVPIDRRHDQPAGGGNVFTAERTGRALRGWRPLESWRKDR